MARTTGGWGALQVAIPATLGTASVGVAVPLAGLPWWAPAGCAIILAGLAGISSAAAAAMGALSPWRGAHTVASILAGGGMAAWLACGAGVAVWSAVLIVAAVGLVVLSYAVPQPAPVTQVVEEPRDRRPEAVRSWERSVQLVHGDKVIVESVTRWDDGDGEDVVVLLGGGKTPSDISQPKALESLVSDRHLLQGCGIEVEDGAHQGQVVLRVQLRATLHQDRAWVSDPSPSSILKPITIMDDAKERPIDICLRHHTMLVGGSTGSGKTTVLHSLILDGQRCPDELQWVMDLNGAGLAIPHIEPWALGECDRPGIDWFAGALPEALAMVCVGRAVSKGRKTSPRVRRRMRAANTDIVPVSEDLRAIIIYADEIAELQKGRGPERLLASLVTEGSRSIIEIGRAAAVRVVLSALRGTSDVADRASKIQTHIKVAMAATEHSEYAPFLGGMYPPKTKLTLPGQAWVLRQSDPRPIMARSRYIDPAAIGPHVVATTRYRGELDEEGRAIAAGLNRLEDFFPPALITPELKRTRLAQDILAGRVYEGRWERQAAVLAGIRGEDYDDEADQVSVEEAIQARHQIPGLDEFRRLTGLADKGGSGGKPASPKAAAATAAPAAALRGPLGDVDAVFGALTSSQHFGRVAPDPQPGRDREPTERPQPAATTTRDRILRYLQEAAPDGLTGAELDGLLERDGAPVSRQARDQACKGLERAGQIVRLEGQGPLVWRLST